MFNDVVIAPSILSADFMNLEHDVHIVEQAGAGFIHVDVMDGHFVNNLTIGVPVVKQLSRVATAPLDVHLMLDNPMKVLPWFLDAGSNMVTIHAETLDPTGLRNAIAQVHEAGAQVGIAIKPKTPVSRVEPFIADLDMVLVMSVEPGFSGQSYIAGSEQKVARVAACAREANPALLIEVDGGIGEKTAGLVTAQGADVLVCGNAVFGADDPAAALVRVQAAGNEARRAALELAEG